MNPTAHLVTRYPVACLMSAKAADSRIKCRIKRIMGTHRSSERTTQTT